MFVKDVRMGVNEGSGAGSILASLVEIYKDRSHLKPWFPTKEAIQRFKDATKRDDATKFCMETPADIKEFLQSKAVSKDEEGLKHALTKIDEAEFISFFMNDQSFSFSCPYLVKTIRQYIDAFGPNFRLSVDGTWKLAWHNWVLICIGVIIPIHAFIHAACAHTNSYLHRCTHNMAQQ
jgi:hypothetical protein